MPQPVPPLTGEERKAVSSHLATQTARRRRAVAERVTIAVDGVECAGMALAGETESTIEIEEGAELVEIRTRYLEEDVLLATHRVAYTEAQGIAPSRATVFLKGGRTLLLEVSPTAAANAEGPRRAVVQISYQPSAVRVWRDDHPALWARSRHAIAASVLVAAGWILGATTGAGYRRLQNVQTPERFSAQRTTTSTLLAKPLPLVTASETAPSYKLVPDDSIVRGPGGPDIPSVMVPSRPSLLRLELRFGAGDARKLLRATLRPFLKKTDILSQILPKTKSIASGAVATFWVPSTVLESNQDYAVDLRSRNSAGGLDEVSSYTFRTVAEPQRTDDHTRSEEPKCQDSSDPSCGADSSNPLKKE